MSRAPTLTDGTVTLRPHREDDLEALFEETVDPVSRQWTNVAVPYSRDRARTYLTELVRRWEDDSRWAFAVEVESRYAGTVALSDEGEGRAGLTFTSHPRARGRGVMRRAVRLLLDWGFETRDVALVAWRAYRGNWPCRRLAWRLGFTFEGTIRGALAHRGELRDAWVGTLLASDDREPKGRWLDVPVLEGDGVRLRPWREPDVPRIVESASDERTQAWLGQMPYPYDEADARTWLEQQQENLAAGRGVQWAVVDPSDDDTALAAIGYFDYRHELELEIGYWAHPDARGHGVVTRAMRRVVEHAFEDLGVRRVRAGAAVGNAASRHVIEANGLVAWGTERMGTTLRSGPADCVFYDLLVEEWRAARRA